MSTSIDMNAHYDPGQTRWSLLGRLKDLSDHDSWRLFFDMYWGLIYSMARKSGLSDAEAQDVVQVTVLDLTRSFSSGKFQADPSHGSFKGYLRQLTRWKILKQVEKRLPQAGGTSLDSPFSSSTSTLEKMPDLDSLDWEKSWGDGWQKALIDAAFTQLSKDKENSSKHLQVFQLYAIRGFEPEKVAKVTGVSVGQVYLIKNRLLPKFGEIVKSIEESGRY